MERSNKYESRRHHQVDSMRSPNFLSSMPVWPEAEPGEYIMTPVEPTTESDTEEREIDDK
jgi:hypothetical protein